MIFAQRQLRGARRYSYHLARNATRDHLSRYVQLATHEEIVVTRHGRPAAVLIGFEDEDDWFDYQLEHDSRFIARMDAARRSLEAGKGISIEQVRTQLGLAGKPRRAL